MGSFGWKVITSRKPANRHIEKQTVDDGEQRNFYPAYGRDPGEYLGFSTWKVILANCEE
jgi:hypothetical protein